MVCILKCYIRYHIKVYCSFGIMIFYEFLKRQNKNAGRLPVILLSQLWCKILREIYCFAFKGRTLQTRIITTYFFNFIK